MSIAPGTVVLVDAEELARVNQELHERQMKTLAATPGIEVSEVNLHYEMPRTRQLEGRAADLTLLDEHEYVGCIPEYRSVVGEEDE